MLKNFRTYHLAKQLYMQCQKLKLKGEVKDQIDRASLSIVLNLVEGSGKATPKDRRRFYHIAFGSIREVQAFLDLLDEQQIAKNADLVAASTWKLIQNPGDRRLPT